MPPSFKGFFYPVLVLRLNSDPSLTQLKTDPELTVRIFHCAGFPVISPFKLSRLKEANLLTNSLPRSHSSYKQLYYWPEKYNIYI